MNLVIYYQQLTNNQNCKIFVDKFYRHIRKFVNNYERSKFILNYVNIYCYC